MKNHEAFFGQGNYSRNLLKTAVLALESMLSCDDAHASSNADVQPLPLAFIKDLVQCTRTLSYEN